MKNLTAVFFVLIAGLAQADSLTMNQKSGLNDEFAYKVMNNSQSVKSGSVFAQITGTNSRNFDQCFEDCRDDFDRCISTAQGTGAWWWCELDYEYCEADCF